MAISRRRFVGGGLATGAAVMLGEFSPMSRLTAAPPQRPSFLEATIPQLQALMNSGRLTSRDLTAGYLSRMAALNPLLGAVIETNPNAISIAVQRDRERRNGQLRGPLHGIPMLVKDNIATADNMQTTAGSRALVNSKVPGDAPIVSRLCAAGAVILGKTNLSEWANFRGVAPFNGWSARGGFTRNPYLLDFDPCGSSSGSAVAPAANLCAASVGTETDGSIVCPSGNNLVVGLKHRAELQLRLHACGRRWLSEHFRADRTDPRREAGGDLDVQRVPARAAAPIAGLRPRTCDPAPAPAGDARRGPTRTRRCRHLRGAAAAADRWQGTHDASSRYRQALQALTRGAPWRDGLYQARLLPSDRACGRRWPWCCAIAIGPQLETRAPFERPRYSGCSQRSQDPAKS